MNNKNQFNRASFKQAIKNFDSFYAGDNSGLVPSRSGAYRFKYDDVKELPEFKGVSKRQFLANKDLQDTAMELAIDGKIPGRKGYNKTAYDLKRKYKTVLRADEIAALSHILGEEKTESFLANPNAENSAGISTQQLTQTLDKFNKSQGTDASYRPKPPVQQEIPQEQVQMPMPQQEAMIPEQPMEQMQNVPPVQMPVEQSQPMPAEQPQQLDISPMPEVEVKTEQIDPANQQLQQMTGVQGANPMAEGGYTSKESSLENLMNTISMSTPGSGKKGSMLKELKNKELEPISVMNAEIEALLPEGRYSDSQQQAQRDTIRAIKKIYGNDVDQKTINNILGNIEIETGWRQLKEYAWSTDNLTAKQLKRETEGDNQYKSILNNWQSYNSIDGNDYDTLSAKDKLSVMYYGNTDHSNFAGGRGVLQLTGAGYGGNQNTEKEIENAARELGLDPAANSNDFYNSTLLTLQTYKNRGHDFSSYGSAQEARKGSVNPWEKYDTLPDHKKETLLKYSNADDNSSVNPEVIANSKMLTPEQKQKFSASNDAGRGVPNMIANNLSQEDQSSSSAPSTSSQAMNFTGGVSPEVQQSLNELSMETFESPRLTTLTPNQFAEGGLVDPPTDPIIGPAEKKGVDDKTKFGYVRPDPEGHVHSLRTPSSSSQKYGWQGMSPITGDSSKYKNDSILSTQVGMDLSSLNNSPGADAFMNTYNNPKTKAMMLAQTDLTSEQYDNMVVQGMEPKVVVGGNEYGSKAEYKNNTVHMGEDYVGNVPIETHERAHASKFDVIQQANIKQALGSAYKQGKDNKKGRAYTDYLNQPHEQYGNFVEFREGLGLEPGTKISPEELNKLVKEKGLDQSGFYKTYNDDNLSNALETVADTGNNNRYLNTAAMGGYMNNKQSFKQFQMALGGSVSDIVTKGGPNDLMQFEGGGTHEQNPLGGIPIGMNNQGQMNSVEEGESKYSFKDGDYVFSNRIKI